MNEQIPEQPIAPEQPVASQDQDQITPPWLEEEAKRLEEETPVYDDDREPLILEDKKVTEFIIQVKKEDWKEYTGDDNSKKKIIPVVHDHKEKIFFLNVRNPVYKEIVLKLKAGTRAFKIMRTGINKQTRYTLVD